MPVAMSRTVKRVFLVVPVVAGALFMSSAASAGAQEPTVDSGPKVAICRSTEALPAALSRSSSTRVKFTFESAGRPLIGPDKLPLAGRGLRKIVRMKFRGTGIVRDLGVLPPRQCGDWDSGKKFVAATGDLRVKVVVRTAPDDPGPLARIETGAKFSVTGARYTQSGDYRLLELRVKVVKGIGGCRAGSKGIIKIDESPSSEKSISSVLRHRVCKWKFAFEKFGKKGKRQKVSVSRPKVV